MVSRCTVQLEHDLTYVCAVVTILVTNTDGLPPSTFDAVYKAAGMDTMSYTPPSAALPQGGWPTLGSLIDSGTRLVTFLAQQADFTQVPYLIDGTCLPSPIALSA